ncbi:helix-turn-helix transcriptional regulator [Streptomyces sp. 891-h]|uniref:helix-turn-helix transcriptional regulator n=1 Tax=unclassified Streptomyces TaxID=2593676 RepID=UPI001FAA7579|nr:helix-turn-helix transcriptional regulator [Streptomyces sp. 891-h]UNZ19366.1 helix-turn-helix domain-containing protein [Streptomyces sp. 891-h]
MEDVTVIAETAAEPRAARSAAGTTRPGGRRRRSELATFLRSRRARVSPADVGMPPGPRRRTPGLRREEVAQLSGVGVTWYTWLEQGRPINASAQVLDAVARTLRLDEAEREHLYHLAEVPHPPSPERIAEAVDPEVHRVLDAMDPMPAVVYNGRYDVLAANSGYRRLFPVLDLVDQPERNVLWQQFVAMPPCCCALLNREAELSLMVATLRGTYGRHVGERPWEEFISRMCEASAEFAGLWRSGDVAPPGARIKLVQHASVGRLRLSSTSLQISGAPETRIVAYVPHDDETEKRLARLRKVEDPLIGCPEHAQPLSLVQERLLRASRRKARELGGEPVAE